MQRRLDAEARVEVVGVHRDDRRRVEGAVEPLTQPGGSGERHLHRDLLVEQHAEESREGVVDEQLVGLGVAGHGKGVRSHGARRYSRLPKVRRDVHRRCWWGSEPWTMVGLSG